jgi:hypothetical protein
LDKFCGKLGQSIQLAIGIPGLHGDILAINVAKLTQPLPQAIFSRCVQGTGSGGKHTYLPDLCRLLGFGEADGKQSDG